MSLAERGLWASGLLVDLSPGFLSRRIRGGLSTGGCLFVWPGVDGVS